MSQSIKQAAYSALDSSRIIATLTIKKAAGNQRVDVGLAHLDGIAPKTTLPSFAEARHADRTVFVPHPH